MNWRCLIKPGCLNSRVRVFYFFLFLTITIIQTWLALQMEESLAFYDDKYPEEKPLAFYDDEENH